jgi:hypothetical protein
MNVLLAAILMLVPGATTSAPAQAPPAAAPCCFVNESYSGTCVVVPVEKETCAGILAYLNTPNTTGKTYCNSTRLRGRWKSAPCDTGKPALASRPRDGAAPEAALRKAGGASGRTGD